MVRTWSVDELCEAVGEALIDRFDGDVWVRGEIGGYRVGPGGHVWFDLVEPGSGDDRRVTRLPVVLFAGTRRGLEAFLRRTTGLELADGVEVRIRGPIEFYGPQAKVQLKMSSIDPRHTLGKLAADRERVLRLMAEAGLLDRNARLPFPLVPLRVGLVTSDDSAAANDFLQELAASGFGFRVTLVDSRVQGADAGAMLAGSLRALVGLPLDVVAVVRGGGSRIDLAAFDLEEVARAVATHPVPVLTGIGHEIDRAVADEVAHAAFKTPTACARALVDAVAAVDTRLTLAWGAIIERAADRLGRADAGLDDRAGRVVRATGVAVGAEADRLDDRARRLGRAGTAGGRRAHERTQRAAARLATIGHAHLRSVSASVDRLAGAVAVSAPRALGRAERDLGGFEAVVRAVHPARTLARGFSITTTTDGRLLRDPADAGPGSGLVTRLERGTLRSTVADDAGPRPATVGPTPEGDPSSP